MCRNQNCEGKRSSVDLILDLTRKQQKLSSVHMREYYQVEFSDLHQLLSIQCDLLHVDGHREHGVGATAHKRNVLKRVRGTEAE